MTSLQRQLNDVTDLPRVAKTQSLIIRGRIRLILNHKRDALDDALAALEGLDKQDPLYSKVIF